MSLVHNMKTNFEGGLNNKIVPPNAPSIAMFYLTNRDASEEDMIKFAEENKFQAEMVVNYFKERKNQEAVNMNILNMKYGIKYTRPDEGLVKDFESKNQNFLQSDVEMNFGLDLLSENIQKKVKKPEFQVINDNNTNKPNNNFSYSSLNNKSSQPQNTNNAFNFPDNKPIDDPKQIQTLISNMKKETKLETRLTYSNLLNNIESNYCLNRFVQLNGNQVIGYWIEDYKEEIESGDKVDPQVFDILTNILKFCDKLPITVQDLKISKIGKKINKLGKCVSDKAIKTKCEELVSRWKRLIENIKDKKKDKHDRDDNDNKRETSSSHSGHTGYNSNISSDNHKSSSNFNDHYSHSSNSPSSNLTKKTKRDSNTLSTSTSSISKEEHGFDKNNKKQRHDYNEEKETDNVQTATASSLSQVTFNNNSQNTYNMSNQSMMKKYAQVTGEYSNSNNNTSIKTKISTSTTTMTMKKGILKKLEMSKKEKKLKVKFEAESKMEKFKIFKMTDEPGAPEVSEDEYQKIQNEILKNPEYKYLSDMRSKEIHMEKENMSKAREKNKQAKDILFRMVPQMNWRRPYDLKIKDNHAEENESGEYDYGSIIRGEESEEKQMVDVLCQKILSVTYFREAEIPECPKIGASQLFCFTNAEIPKIENLKKAYNPEKPNPNAEILEFIDKNYEATPSPDFIKTLIKKIQDKEFTSEECTRILEYLNKHSNTNKDNAPVMNPQMKMMSVPFPHSQFSQFNPHMNMHAMNMNTAGNFAGTQDGGKKYMNKMPLHNMHPMGMNPMNPMNPMNMQMPFNKMQPSKYKTRPCRNFHGPNGCNRGDNCHFIHDPNFEGREIPDFNYMNYKNSSDKKVLITNVNIVNNYGIQDKEKELSEKGNEETNSNFEEKCEEEKNKKSGVVDMINMNNQSNQSNKPNFPMHNQNFSRPSYGMHHNMPNMPNIPNMPNMHEMQMRPPFMPNMNMNMNMSNMPNMNMNPHFMNQNPYWNMNMNNFIRGQLPMHMNMQHMMPSNAQNNNPSNTSNPSGQQNQ